MQFNIEQKALLDIINQARITLGDKDDAFIKFEISNEVLLITSVKGSMQQEIVVSETEALEPNSNDQYVNCVVDGKILSQALAKFPTGKIKVKCLDTHMLIENTVSKRKAKMQLNVKPENSFVPIVAQSTAETWKVKTSALANLLKVCGPRTHKSAPQPILQSVLITHTDGELSARAVDGQHATMFGAELGSDQKLFTYECCQAMQAILDYCEDGYVKLLYSTKQCLMETSSTNFICPLTIESPADYPNVDEYVVPLENMVDLKDLLECCQLASVLAPDGIIQIQSVKQQLELVASGVQDNGTSAQRIEMQGDGNILITVPVKTMISCLNILSSEQIHIGNVGAESNHLMLSNSEDAPELKFLLYGATTKE